MSRCPLNVGIKDKPDVPSLFMLKHSEPLPVTNSEIQSKTRTSQIVGKVVSLLESYHMNSVDNPDLVPSIRSKNKLFLWNGCVMWGVWIVVLACLRSRILQKLRTVHLRVVKMKGVTRSFMWWPGIDGDIEQIAADCNSCQ